MPKLAGVPDGDRFACDLALDASAARATEDAHQQDVQDPCADILGKPGFCLSGMNLPRG